MDAETLVYNKFAAAARPGVSKCLTPNLVPRPFFYAINRGERRQDYVLFATLNSPLH